MTILFQEPGRYQASVAENIALQKLHANAGRAAIEKAQMRAAVST